MHHLSSLTWSSRCPADTLCCGLCSCRVSATWDILLHPHLHDWIPSRPQNEMKGHRQEAFFNPVLPSCLLIFFPLKGLKNDVLQLWPPWLLNCNSLEVSHLFPYWWLIYTHSFVFLIHYLRAGSMSNLQSSSQALRKALKYSRGLKHNIWMNIWVNKWYVLKLWFYYF